MSYNLEIFRIWEAKALEDERSARLLLDHEGPPATICLLCQQLVEKYLKAFALLHDRPLKRTHNLGVLLKDAATFDERLWEFEAQARKLSEYYFTSRYPGDLPEDFSPEDATEAYAAASRITAMIGSRVERLLKASSDPPVDPVQA